MKWHNCYALHISCSWGNWLTDIDFLFSTETNLKYKRSWTVRWSLRWKVSPGRANGPYYRSGSFAWLQPTGGQQFPLGIGLCVLQPAFVCGSHWSTFSAQLFAYPLNTIDLQTPLMIGWWFWRRPRVVLDSELYALSKSAFHAIFAAPTRLLFTM